MGFFDGLPSGWSSAKDQQGQTYCARCPKHNAPFSLAHPMITSTTALRMQTTIVPLVPPRTTSRRRKSPSLRRRWRSATPATLLLVRHRLARHRLARHRRLYHHHCQKVGSRCPMGAAMSTGGTKPPARRHGIARARLRQPHRLRACRLRACRLRACRPRACRLPACRLPACRLPACRLPAPHHPMALRHQAHPSVLRLRDRRRQVPHRPTALRLPDHRRPSVRRRPPCEVAAALHRHRHPPPTHQATLPLRRRRRRSFLSSLAFFP